MRIGLFTDTYHPSTNGIVVVVDIMRKQLEALGHEVFIVAPAASLKWWHLPEHNVIRFAALRGVFFQESSLNFFFPPKQYRRIQKLNLDAIVLFTPAQIGLMGAYSAIKSEIPLISQYSTDLPEYVQMYPGVMPGVLALYSTVPFTTKPTAKELAKITKQLLIKNNRDKPWSTHSAEVMLTHLHNRCDAVISVSPKVTKMLKNWGTKSEIATIPTGVDKGMISQTVIQKLRKKYGLRKEDQLILYLGRVAEEKNIDLLVEAFPLVRATNKNAKLMIVGDFDYRQILEEKVKKMGISHSVIFTGKVPFAERWNYFALADVFAFPSLSDTQALVVNEASLMGVPTVWCDKGVNEVLKHNVSGLLAMNNPVAFAGALLKLLNDKKLRTRLGKSASARANNFSELSQTKKFIRVLEKAIGRRSKAQGSRS